MFLAAKTGEHKFVSGNPGNLCVKESRSDSTPPVREMRRVDMKDWRERLHGIAEGTSSATHHASSSVESFPGGNRCPGTHCSTDIAT